MKKNKEHKKYINKIFDGIICNNTYNYLIDNNLISQNHSSFKHGGSTNFNNFYYRQYFEFTR